MPNVCVDTPSGPIPQAPELLTGAGVALSEKAAEHIRKSLQTRGCGIGLRLGVGASGCSGLSYKLEYADEASANDHVFESHGVKVVVDDKSLPFLQGVVLNWVREGLNEGFKFENPNVKNSCGCGESFTV